MKELEFTPRDPEWKKGYKPAVVRNENYVVIGIDHVKDEDIKEINFNTVKNELKKIDDSKIVLVCETEGSPFYASSIKENVKFPVEFIETDQTSKEYNNFERESMPKKLYDIYVTVKYGSLCFHHKENEREKYLKDLISSLEKKGIDTNSSNQFYSLSESDQERFLDITSPYDDQVRNSLVWIPRLKEIKQKYPSKKMLIECGGDHMNSVVETINNLFGFGEEQVKPPTYEDYKTQLSKADQRFIEKFE